MKEALSEVEIAQKFGWELPDVKKIANEMRAKSTADEREIEKLKILFFKDLLKPDQVAK